MSGTYKLALLYAMALCIPGYCVLFQTEDVSSGLGVGLFLQSAVALAAIIMLVRDRLDRGKSPELEREFGEKAEELAKKERELSELQKLNLSQIQRAGMFEITTGVLHNVGNFLNSVVVSVDVLDKALRNSNIKKLRKANLILHKNLDNFESFVSSDPKGKKLLKYYLKLGENLTKEHKIIRHHVDCLIEKTKAIEDAINSQQNWARPSGGSERLLLSEVVDQAIKLERSSISRHDIKLDLQFQETAFVRADRTKMIQVIINIYKNAKEAMSELNPEDKLITVKIYQEQDQIFLSFTDTGHGIRQNRLQRVFEHGFTTKRNGHGFGLDSCARYMAEMGGKLWAESDGEGRGATFIMQLPASDGLAIAAGEQPQQVTVVAEESMDVRQT